MQKLVTFAFFHSCVGVSCEPARHAGGRIKCPSNLCGAKQRQVAQVKYIIVIIYHSTLFSNLFIIYNYKSSIESLNWLYYMYSKEIKPIISHF